MGKRKIQQKTTSTRAPGGKPKLPIPKDGLICPRCGEVQEVRESSMPLKLELPFRQRFPEIAYYQKPGWSLKAIQENRFAWACDACIAAGWALEAKPWLQITGYNHAIFVYVNQAKTCADCGTKFDFTAQEQAYWYETLEIPIYSEPKHCLDCRRKRRKVKRANTELSELVPPETIADLLQRAELYEQMGNLEKALLCLRRAKNKTRSVELREQLLVRIAGLEQPQA